MERSWIQRPSVIAALTEPIMATAEERGARREILLERFGLTPAQVNDPDARVSITRLLEGWMSAMQQTKSPGLPIAVGQKSSLGLYRSFGYALYTSRTGEEAFQRLSRYHDVINNTGRWRFTVESNRVVMLWKREGDRELGMRVANEQLVASFATIARQVIGGAAPIDEIHFRHSKPVDTTEHEAHFKAPIRWGADEDALILPVNFLELVPFGSDRLLSAHFVADVDRRLGEVTQDRSYSTEVARVITDLLCDGIPTSAQVSERLGTSERTLRRRLSAEEQTFEALLALIQREQALERLRAGASVRDAAFAAGFLDASSFARAFRRWTGKSPSEIRSTPADKK